jgi:hypothetical protein
MWPFAQPSTSRTPTRCHGGDVKPSREVAEVEVESVAFIVCDALGLDTSDYSFPYVAQWSAGDENLLRTTGDRVVGCAKGILGGLEALGALISDEVDMGGAKMGP